MTVVKGRQGRANSKIKVLEQEEEIRRPILCSIDVGFGHMKLFSNVRPGFRVFPSAVSMTKNPTFGNMKATGEVIESNLVVEIDGKMSYVGERALVDLTPNKKRTTEPDRANDKISRILFQTAIALSLPDVDDDYEDVHVVTGLPNREYGTQVQDDLEEFLLKPFTVKIYTSNTTYVEKRISVSKVTIYRQPMGSYMFYQYKYGNPLNGESLLVPRWGVELERVGVIDIGQQTTDYTIIVRNNVSDNRRLTGSIVGTNEVYVELEGLIEDAIATVKRNNFISIKEIDLDRAIHDKVFKDAKVDIPVDTEVKEALSYVAPQIIGHIFSRWGNDLESLEEVLITGGGAELFREALKKEFEGRTSQTFSIIPNSQHANVMGFYMSATSQLALEYGEEEVFHEYASNFYQEDIEEDYEDIEENDIINK